MIGAGPGEPDVDLLGVRTAGALLVREGLALAARARLLLVLALADGPAARVDPELLGQPGGEDREQQREQAAATADGDAPAPQPAATARSGPAGVDLHVLVEAHGARV